MSNDLDNGLWHGYKETKRLVNQQVREVASTRSAATFENLKGWKIFKNPSAVVPKGNVVAVRVHKKDRGQTGERGTTLSGQGDRAIAGVKRRRHV